MCSDLCFFMLYATFAHATCCCSAFLGNIRDAFKKNPELTNLMMDDFFAAALHRCQVRGVGYQLSSSLLTMVARFTGIVADCCVASGSVGHPYPSL
jgi:6-phosphogluconate dehydrogenase